MKSGELIFPVLSVAKDGTVEIEPTLDNFTRDTARGVRSRYTTGVIVIDSAGRAYRICNARIIEGIGPLWGYFLITDRFVRVEYELEEDASMTLEKLKEIVLTNIKTDSSWDSTEKPARAFARTAKKADSLADLVQRLAKMDR